MRIVLLTILAAVALANSTPVLDKPLFQIIASRSMIEPPLVTVTFANGVQDDLVLEHYKMHESSPVECNYLGQLRNSPSSNVAVTGCMNKPGDRMDITLISEHNINKMFTVDFLGNTEIVKNPFENGATSRAIKTNTLDRRLYQPGDWVRNGDEEVDAKEEAAAATAKYVSIPSKLKAVVKFGYDETIKRRLGGQRFDSWIQSVFTHTKVHFRAPSLGTVIEFQVQGSPTFKSGARWTADNNIDDARRATRHNGADTMSWWCDKDQEYGTAGIAYLGALCGSYGMSLCEWQDTQAASGFVLAHEIGHNFGMSHDFDPKHGGKNGRCNNKGIMSYGHFSFDQWSSCSKSDWEEHYASENWLGTCLEDISGGSSSSSGSNSGSSTGSCVAASSTYNAYANWCSGSGSTSCPSPYCKRTGGSSSGGSNNGGTQCRDTYSGDCSKYTWACRANGSEWFANQCKRTCGIC